MEIIKQYEITIYNSWWKSQFRCLHRLRSRADQHHQKDYHYFLKQQHRQLSEHKMNYIHNTHHLTDIPLQNLLHVVYLGNHKTTLRQQGRLSSIMSVDLTHESFLSVP